MENNSNRKQLEELFVKYYDKIFNYIFRSTLNREATEDILSNTFLKVVKLLESGHQHIENMNAYLYRMASNEICNYMKKEKRQLQVTEKIKYYTGDDEVSTEEFSAQYTDYFELNKGLKKLNKTERSLIQLHYMERMKYSEIALILKKKESTLRSVMTRAIKKLNRIMNEDNKGLNDEKEN